MDTENSASDEKLIAEADAGLHGLGSVASAVVTLRREVTRCDEASKNRDNLIVGITVASLIILVIVALFEYTR